jgi:YVTN family beta-propeller protein
MNKVTTNRATLTIVAGLLISVLAFAQDQATQPGPQRSIGEPTKQLPKYIPGGFDLPNGWRITPAGKAVATIEDLVLNLVVSPNGRIVVASHSGYLPHGIDVFDVKSQRQIQHIELKTTWLGMTWSPDGHTLYVSGGNATGAKTIAQSAAPIYEFSYRDGRLSEQPTGSLLETVDPSTVWWSGVAYLPSRRWLYAANRGTGLGPSNVVVFDLKTRAILTRIPVEINPYQVVLTPDGKRLFVSNWSSESVSVIDTTTNKVIRTLRVGMNPNDMKLSADGRLFVACSNDNTVHVIDTRTLQVMERLSTTLTPFAPEGSTPDALEVDDVHKLLYIANADNNSIAVAHIANRAHTTIVGFIPTGWYPSALAEASSIDQTGHREHALQRFPALRSSSSGSPDDHSSRGRRVYGDQTCHLHHQGEPHLRSGVRRSGRRQRRPRAHYLRREGHSESARPGKGICNPRQSLL